VLSTSELVEFLADNRIQACGDEKTLPARAWKLREALRSNNQLLLEDLSAEAR